MNFLRIPKIDIAPNEPPPSAITIVLLREELEQLRKTVSGTATATLGLALVSFIAYKFTPYNLAGVAFVLSSVLFVVLHRWERAGLARLVASVQPIPDELCAETAALCQLSETSRQYCAVVRSQGRDFIQAEYEGLRRAARSLTSSSVGREILYGTPGNTA